MFFRPVGSQFFLADRRTDIHDEANSRFRLKTHLAQEDEENIRVGKVCERSVRIKGNEVWDNRKDGFRSEHVYWLGYDIYSFVS